MPNLLWSQAPSGFQEQSVLKTTSARLPAPEATDEAGAKKDGAPNVVSAAKELGTPIRLERGLATNARGIFVVLIRVNEPNIRAVREGLSHGEQRLLGKGVSCTKAHHHAAAALRKSGIRLHDSHLPPVRGGFLNQRCGRSILGAHQHLPVRVQLTVQRFQSPTERQIGRSGFNHNRDNRPLEKFLDTKSEFRPVRVSKCGVT